MEDRESNRTGRILPWLVGLAAFAGGLLVHFPATLLDARLDRSTGGVARLAEARGTAWSGTGYIEVRDRNLQFGHAYPLAWRFQPLSLLRGQLGFEVALGRDRLPVPLTLDWSGVELADVRMLLPAAAIGLAVPQLSPLELRGELTLHIERLRISGHRVTGNASLDWRRAGSTLTRVFPLGDYRWDIRSNGSGFKVAMQTLQGPLQLEGKGAWPAGAPPVFQGQARVPLPLQPQLAPLLRLIAIERGAGAFEISIR
ncbi:MAG: type II secretion system protein N [Burkholderiales bacterium]